MPEFDNTDTGVLFHNDKEGNEARPDYKGKLNVNGKDYEIAGWKRIAKSSGKSFLSLKVQEPKDWVQEETREKLKKDEVVAVDENEEIDLQNIPF